MTGVAAALCVLAAVAVPAFISALFAVASFTYSEPPEPAVGVLWAGIAVLLLTLPVAAGLLTSRVRSSDRPARSARGWMISAGIAMVLIVLWRIIRTVV